MKPPEAILSVRTLVVPILPRRALQRHYKYGRKKQKIYFFGAGGAHGAGALKMKIKKKKKCQTCRFVRDL
jgi:hypothetical protein